MLIAKGEHAPSMELNKQDKFQVQWARPGSGLVRMGPDGCVLSLSHLYSSAPCRANAVRFLQWKQSCD